MRGQNSKPKINVFRNFFATNFGLCEKVSDLKSTKIKNFCVRFPFRHKGLRAHCYFLVVQIGTPPSYPYQ